MRYAHFLSVSVVLGAAAAALSDVAPTTALATALIAAAGLVICDHRRLAGALLIIVAGAAAAAHAAVARDRALSADTAGLLLGRDDVERTVDEVERAEGDASGPHLVTGTLIDDSEVMPDGSVRLLLDAVSVGAGPSSLPVRFRAQSYVGGAFAARRARDWLRGRQIRAPMSLRAPQTLHNPGGRSPRSQNLLRGYHLSGSVKSALVVEVEPGDVWSETGARVRQFVRTSIDTAFVDRQGETRAVVAAILIGDRGGLSDETERRLQRAGTYHVIAISGGNVALLAGFVLLVARRVVRSARLSALFAMAVVIAYGFVVGSEPSVSRAVTAASIYLAATALGVAPSPSHVLGLAAMSIALVDPLMTLAAGAWLSYGATLGILLLAGGLSARLEAVRLDGGSAIRTLGVAAGGLAAATAAAELVLLPVSASLFARVGVAGLVLNFIAVPAMAIVQITGVMAVLLSLVSSTGAGGAAWVAELAVRAIVDSARLVDYAPWLSWHVAPPALPWVVCFYGALSFACWTTVGRLRGSAAAIAALCVCGMLLTPELAWARPPSGWLRWTMVDVGQGEAMVVQFPSGRALLVDAGMASATFDSGERVVAPTLWALGIRRLDWLAITHPDLDHDGGAAVVASAFKVGEVWEGVPVAGDVQRVALKAVVARNGGGWRQLQIGDYLEVGAVSVDVLHPSRPDWERQRVRNDDSLVLRLRYGRVELLLTGDVSSEVEAVLDPGRPAPPLRILKVAHHGSRSSSDAAFLQRYQPVLALVSAGRGNVFGHPSPDVLRRLRASHVPVFRTDQDRAIMVETDGVEVRVRSWSGRSWRGRAWGSF